MRYHPKSNQGRFSKKQKKSSRLMMSMRRGFETRGARNSFHSIPEKFGLFASILAMAGLGKRTGAR